MKDNEFVEILPDGTVYYVDLDVCSEEADKVMEELYEKEDTVPNFDYTSAVFTLFINSIHTLSNSGWTTEELIQEVSFTGIKSSSSGVHTPVVRVLNVSSVPLNTLRSRRLPGTPYLGAIPQDVYCHITH